MDTNEFTRQKQKFTKQQHKSKLFNSLTKCGQRFAGQVVRMSVWAVHFFSKCSKSFFPVIQNLWKWQSSLASLSRFVHCDIQTRSLGNYLYLSPPARSLLLSWSISRCCTSVCSVCSSRSRCILRFVALMRVHSSSASSSCRFSAFTRAFALSTCQNGRTVWSQTAKQK